MLGTTSMYYVPHPTETAGLIQTLLSREGIEIHTPSSTDALTEKNEITSQI